MSGEPIILEGYNAARFTADMNTGRIRPGNKKIRRTPFIDWKDATEEQKETLKWHTFNDGGRNAWTQAYFPFTEEEKQIRKDNELYHYEKMFKYILENYGNDYADKFAKECIEKDMEISIEAYPHCDYAEGQCNMFCDFYEKGQCLYED